MYGQQSGGSLYLSPLFLFSFCIYNIVHYLDMDSVLLGNRPGFTCIHILNVGRVTAVVSINTLS